MNSHPGYLRQLWPRPQLPQIGGNDVLVSMTGFGTGVSGDEKQQIRVEIRTVNHRYRDVVIHTPHPHAGWEESIRQIVHERLHRGRVEIFVVIEDFGLAERTVRLNKSLLEGFAATLSEATRVVGPLNVTLESLLLIPDMFVVTEKKDADLWPLIEQALSMALDSLVNMRQSEGQRLQQDMLQRLHLVEQWLDDIAERVPSIVAEYRERLGARLAELVASPSITEDRLAAEMIIFADRCCISEELVRARSHITHFREACTTNGQVGRKLDFLLQELNREVNTMASKTADSQAAAIVVDIKAELEKIREQAQNIE
jgi:uncharacterized protein (TIGR00255 family)